MEENRRRIEASMARKRNNPTFTTAAITADAPSSSSPTGTGAMDTLLEKLRAAAPQARDQRDRRRRARLKDRHQVRIASGQKIPDMADLTKSTDPAPSTSAPLPTGNVDGAIDTIPEHDASEAEDVADRAANMLQGLRGDGADGEDGLTAGTGLRVRRRRESADDERKNRRRRRTAVGSSTGSGGGDQASTLPSAGSEPSTIVEESVGEGNEVQPSKELDGRPAPSTVVSPPSPSGTESKPLEILD